MKLKTKTDFCLRALIYLQQNEGKSRVVDIAEELGISKNHLSVAINKLSELDYIISTQGPKGGVEFNPIASERSVEELISKVEEFHIVECFDAESNTCSLSPNCKLKGMLSKATKSFLNELKNYKIKDLV